MHAVLLAIAFVISAVMGTGVTARPPPVAAYKNDVVVHMLGCQYLYRCTADASGVNVCALKWHCARSIDD